VFGSISRNRADSATIVGFMSRSVGEMS
jgi:hypothetical protein